MIFPGLQTNLNSSENCWPRQRYNWNNATNNPIKYRTCTRQIIISSHGTFVFLPDPHVQPCLTFSIIIFLSLLTFSVKDNSFFNYNSALDKTQNILGILGSYLSDLLLRTFGIIIYFLPLTLLIWSIKVIFLKSAITWLNFLFLPITILFLSFYEVFLNQPDLKVFPESNSGFAGIGIN